VGTQPGGDALEVRGEADQLDDAGLGLGDPRLDQVAQAALDRRAALAVEQRHQFGDVLERQTEALGPRDEPQRLDVRLGVER